MFLTSSRSWSCSLVAALLFTVSTGAQAPSQESGELLDEVRRTDKVIADKAEADLRLTLREAQQMASANPTKALERLTAALANLDNDKVFSGERRESLKRMLKDRIRLMELQIASGKQTPTLADRSAEERRTAESQDISRGLRTIKELQDQGKTEQASREASDLARRYPQNPALHAAERTAASVDEAAKTRRFQKERERQLAGAQRDIERSATPASGEDVEFPKDWNERTKGRTTAIQLTAKEKAILQALSTPISVSFKNSKLEDVIEYLQTLSGQTILLDKESLRDAEASYDTPVTLHVKGVTLRTVLRKILSDLGMTYVVKDEIIHATSAQRAKELMVVRRYYIGDLLANMSALGQLNALPFVRPLANQETQATHMMQTVKELIEMIQSSVDTQSWQTNGGNGTITFHAPSLSLLVKQSAEVHALLANSALTK